VSFLNGGVIIPKQIFLLAEGAVVRSETVWRTEEIRWLGIAAVLGAILFAIYEVGTGIVTVGFAEAPETWALLYAVAMFASFFTILGFTGIYSYQAALRGVLGLATFVVILLGIVAFLAWAWGGVVIIPAVVAYDPGFLSAQSEAWLYTSIFLISHLLLALGIFLLGVMTWQDDRLPRAAAGLLLFGSIGGAVDAAWNLGPIDPPFGPIIIAAAGLAWIGLTIWRSSSQQT
jgi:hypothetical protein